MDVTALATEDRAPRYKLVPKTFATRDDKMDEIRMQALSLGKAFSSGHIDVTLTSAGDDVHAALSTLSLPPVEPLKVPIVDPPSPSLPDKQIAIDVPSVGVSTEHVAGPPPIARTTSTLGTATPGTSTPGRSSLGTSTRPDQLAQVRDHLRPHHKPPQLSRMSTTTIQQQVGEGVKERVVLGVGCGVAITWLIFFFMAVLPIWWTGSLFVTFSARHAVCDTDILGFLGGSYASSLVLTVIEIILACCTNTASDDYSCSAIGQLIADRANPCIKLVGRAVLFGYWLYGITAVFGTLPGDKCDAKLWNGAYGYIIYTFFAVPIALVLTIIMYCCVQHFAKGQIVDGKAEVERRRAVRGPGLV